MMTQTILAIDLGSTSIKAALFAADHTLLGEAGRPIIYSTKEGDQVELAPQTVLNIIQQVVETALGKAGLTAADINAVGIASQAQTFTMVNQTGEAVMPFISWLDRRATANCLEMSNDELFRDFGSHSSLATLYPTMQICQAARLLRQNPEPYRNCRLTPLPAYLIQKLIGKSITDNNLAPMGGFYSLQSHSWYQPYLKYCHLELSQMPELVAIGAQAGEITEDNFLNLPTGCRLFCCGNDQTAGAYGAQLASGDMLINLGTAHITYACRKSLPQPQDGLFRGIYPGDRYYAMAAEDGGALLSIMLDSETTINSFDDLAEAAENGTPGKVAFIALQSGQLQWSDNSAPLTDRAYALFDYLAERVKVMSQLVCGKKMSAKRIFLTGGGRKNAILVRLIKEKVGSNITEMETSPLQGACFMVAENLNREIDL